MKNNLAKKGDTSNKHLLNKRPQGIYWFIYVQQWTKTCHNVTFTLRQNLSYSGDTFIQLTFFFFFFWELPQVSFSTTGMSFQGIKRSLENPGMSDTPVVLFYLERNEVPNMRGKKWHTTSRLCRTQHQLHLPNVQQTSFILCFHLPLFLQNSRIHARKEDMSTST